MVKVPSIDTHVRTRIRKTEKRTFAWQIFLGFFRFFILGICIGIVWYVTRLPFFTITEVSVEGGETISLSDIQYEVDMELQGAYARLVPKRFTYLYPHDRIVEVVDAHDRIHNVTVSRTSRTAIVVRFDEYIPHALWCAQSDEATCYFMTSDGYAFGVAPRLDGGAFVRYVTEGVHDLHEGVVMQPERLQALDGFLTRLSNELGLRVSMVVQKENGDATLRINGGGALYITLDDNFDVTLDHIKAILASPEFAHLEPGNFQYIDVRFDAKAYVNEEIPNETGSTTVATTTLPEL